MPVRFSMKSLPVCLVALQVAACAPQVSKFVIKDDVQGFRKTALLETTSRGVEGDAPRLVGAAGGRYREYTMVQANSSGSVSLFSSKMPGSERERHPSNAYAIVPYKTP